MEYQDGDTVLLDNRQRAEIVGVRMEAYDLFVFNQNKIVRNVHPDFLTHIS